MAQWMDDMPESEGLLSEPTRMEKKKMLRDYANFAGLFMLVLVISFQLVPNVMWALFAQVTPYGNTVFLLVYGLVYAVTMGLPLLLLLGKRRFNPLTPTQRVHPGVGFLGCVGAVGVCMLANVITSFILMFFSTFGVEAAPPPKLMVDTPISFALNLVVMAVLPALLEELVFRGCLLRLLRVYGDGTAVVVSAVLFGLMHGNLRQVPFAIIVGLVLGWLYVVTENIWMPILVHFLNNAIAVTTEYLSFSLTEEEASWMSVTLIFRLVAVGVVAVALLLLFYRHRLKLKKSDSGLSSWDRIRSLASSWTLMGSTALFILLLLMEMFLNG